MTSNYALTANGAPSLASTLDYRLDLFVKTTREVGVLPVERKKIIASASAPSDSDGSDDDSDSESLVTLTNNDNLYAMIDKSWSISPLDTMKILFNWRDCRGGKGDHRGFIVSMIYIEQKYNDWFLVNFKVIPEYGSWLDLVKLWHFVGPESKQTIMSYLFEKLNEDRDNLGSDTDTDKNKISLLAKWLPSENSKWDRYSKDRFVVNMCKLFSSRGNSQYIRAEYIKMLRTVYVSPLRKHLQLVESKMCAKDFSIKYETVPSVAMKKYRKAFARNDEEGFAEYMRQVKSGEKKINAGQVYPHDLVRHYLDGGMFDPVIEEQWNVIKKTAQETGAFKQSICVCDVSGSMAGTPLEVAVALGLLGLYNDQVITFSETPELHKIPKGTLQEQVSNIAKMSWGMSTNFEKTMDLVLTLCMLAGSEQIKRVLIYSDMQFDMAVKTKTTTYNPCIDYKTSAGTKTMFQLVKQKFQKAEVSMPQIVFWNLNGSTKDFPVTSDENGVVMMSGYSPALLSSLVDGLDISPLTMLLKVIGAPRYDKIVAPITCH